MWTNKTNNINVHYCQNKTYRICLQYNNLCHTSNLNYLCVILQSFPTGLIQHQVNRPEINPTKSRKTAATIWENFTAIELSLTTWAYTSETDQLWLMKLKSSQVILLKLYFRYIPVKTQQKFSIDIAIHTEWKRVLFRCHMYTKYVHFVEEIIHMLICIPHD